MIFDWIANQIPWWVPLALGVAGMVGAFIGMRAMGLSARQAWLAASLIGLLAGVATIHQRGRRAGAQAAQRQQQRVDERAVATRQKVAERVSRAPAPEIRERLRRWSKPQS